MLNADAKCNLQRLGGVSNCSTPTTLPTPYSPRRCPEIRDPGLLLTAQEAASGHSTALKATTMIWIMRH